MTNDLFDALARLPQGPPRWVLRGIHDAPADPARAEAFLATLDGDDRRLLDLVYGVQLDLGLVATTLGLDPAVVIWRVRRLLEREADGRAPSLEVAVAHHLRPGPPEACREPAREHIDGCSRCRALRLPDDERRRLVARLVLHEEGARTLARGGIGIGSGLLVLIVIAGFGMFGYLRDTDPYTTGRRALLRGDWEQGREDLLESMRVSPSFESTFQIAASWIGEGDFEAAHAWIDEHPILREKLGDFLPSERAIEPLEDAPREADALLPRGPLLSRRPTFVVRPGPAGLLVLTAGARTQEVPLPASDTDEPVVVPYPEDWPPLPPGDVFWSVRRGDETGPASATVSFEVASERTRARLRRRRIQVAQFTLVDGALPYLVGHYYLRNGVLSQAGWQFAELARRFPDAEYPQRALAEIADAVGVDPDAFMQ